MLEKIESDLHKDAITDRCKIVSADLHVKCECTLEEFFHGSTKEIVYFKERAVAKGSVKEEAVREIEIKPGMKAGMQMRFPGEGNTLTNMKVGDLVVTIEAAAHSCLRRDGDDLIYRHRICLADALSMAVVEFKTLEGEVIKFRPDQVITPEFTKVLSCKGMPIYNDNPLSPLMMDHDRGNFVLQFQIEFPTALSREAKNKVATLLTCTD